MLSGKAPSDQNSDSCDHISGMLDCGTPCHMRCDQLPSAVVPKEQQFYVAEFVGGFLYASGSSLCSLLIFSCLLFSYFKMDFMFIDFFF